MRLRRESAGLRSLISGLVGGSALLARWDAEWLAKFGGEEADEVQDSDENDEGDEDGSDEDDEGGSGAPKKKVKVVKEKEIKPKKTPDDTTGAAGAGVIGPNGDVIGKRKRGRPRKVQPAPPVPVINGAAVIPSAVATGEQKPASQNGGTYLLGVFLFFSFFKSDGSSSSSASAYASAASTHAGTVLTASPYPNSTAFAASLNAAANTGWTWVDFMHTLHTVISFLLLVALFLPFIPSLFRPKPLTPEEQAERQAGIKLALEQGGASRKKLAVALGQSERVGVMDVALEGSRWIRGWMMPWGNGAAQDGDRASLVLEKDAWVRMAELDLSSGMSRLAEHRVNPRANFSWVSSRSFVAAFEAPAHISRTFQSPFRLPNSLSRDCCRARHSCAARTPPHRDYFVPRLVPRTESSLDNRRRGRRSGARNRRG